MWLLVLLNFFNFALIDTQFYKPTIQFYDLTYKVCNNSNEWTIHGLWPEYNSASWPQYCNNTPFNYNQISQYQPELNDRWTGCTDNLNDNIKFWSHEWTRHGSCTNMTLSKYFNTTLNLDRVNVVNNIFDKYCNSSQQCMIQYDRNFVRMAPVSNDGIYVIGGGSGAFNERTGTRESNEL